MNRSVRPIRKIPKGDYKQQRHKIIFDYSPIAIWEEDFSAVAKLRRYLERNNVRNIRNYLNQNQELVISTFRKIKILDVNKAAMKLYGAQSKKELISNFGKVIDKDALRVLIDEFAALIEGKQFFEAEFKSKTLNGRKHEVRLTVSVPEVYQKSFKRVIATLQDISVQKKYERHLKKLALTDGLTKVLNHNAILHRLDEEFRRSKRYKLKLSCLMIDLDHFKGINDLCGHQKGDQVLRQSASMFKKHLREVDIIGRYGGDEFLVILPETSSAHALVVADRLIKIFDRLSSRGKEKTHYSTVSIGIGGYPSQGINSSMELVAKVDKAMYAAKKAGRNRIFYS